MECLNCGKEMTNYLIQTKNDQLSYDVCEACGSFWLDKGELDKLAFRVIGDIEYCSQEKAEENTGIAKMCPRCDNAQLDKVNFLGCSDIILDHCHNCGGFWLDGGKLDLINADLEKIMPVQGKGFSEFVNETHLPYWVKRIRRPSHETDFKIPVLPIKGAKVKSSTEDICPVCQTRLDLYEDFHIDFEACPKCRGMWLDKEKIKQLKSKSEDGALRWMDDELDAIEKTQVMLVNRYCPHCKETKLLATKFGKSNLVIDWCPSCHGIWLERDEFLNIIEYLEEEYEQLSSREVAKQAEKEIEKIFTGHDNKITEIVDAETAVKAMVNFYIFEHPKLASFLFKVPFGTFC